MLLPFTKMHGLGNDFIVVEGLSREVNLSSEQIRTLADRHTGIGFDQLLMIEPPQEYGVDFNYRIFNADGGEVEQCGNGVRCLAKYVCDKKLTSKMQITVSTMNALMQIQQVDRDRIEVDMGEPRFAPEDLPFETSSTQDYYSLEHSKGTTEVGICSMGNPHAVIAVDSVEHADVSGIGPLIESHPRFPEHVNAGFMQIVNRQSIQLRVYERGAGETRACGTGACAAMAVARRFDLVDENVEVQLAGGPLDISWKGQGSNLLMCGQATTVFEGKVRI